MNEKTKETLYENLTITPLADSELEIRGTIPAPIFERHRSASTKKLSEYVNIDGFRKGHIPEDVLVKHIGEMTILEEMAERAIADAYPAIILDNELDVIGRPHISITKLAKDNPVEFVAKTAILPKFELPDYKAIAEKARKPFDKADFKVEEKEIDDAILGIRKRMAHFEKFHADGTDIPHDAHEGEDIPESELPPVTDEFVQKLGDFKTVADLRTALSTNIKSDKELKEKEKKRLAIVEALVEKTTISIPAILRDAELDKMMGEFKSEIERMGLDVDQYFLSIKKTPEDVRSEWMPEAEKRAKLQLILNAIANKEDVLLEEKRVSRDVAHVLEHYKEANPDSIRMYVETMMRNEKVFEMLEGKKTESTDTKASE